MSFGDARGMKVAVVAHCILNQNTVVRGLASHPGAVAGLAKLLIDLGYGIVQLPCPETAYAGLRRWWASREQYDNEAYREFSRAILEPTVKVLRELRRAGCRIALIGVRGSPSCALKITTSNPSWGGRPAEDELPRSTKVEGPGVFMEELKRMMEERGIGAPDLELDVDHEEIARAGVPEEVASALRSLAEGRRQGDNDQGGAEG
ncbi:MAG: CD3072 family TudS-related putative desulfidase [Desulfurococcaceae archaeon]